MKKWPHVVPPRYISRRLFSSDPAFCVSARHPCLRSSLIWEDVWRLMWRRSLRWWTVDDQTGDSSPTTTNESESDQPHNKSYPEQVCLKNYSKCVLSITRRGKRISVVSYNLGPLTGDRWMRVVECQTDNILTSFRRFPNTIFLRGF